MEGAAGCVGGAGDVSGDAGDADGGCGAGGPPSAIFLFMSCVRMIIEQEKNCTASN